jgi:CubicO group peptidase (beta-lactamase class C family)
VTTVAERTDLAVAIDQVADELVRWRVPGAEIAVVRDGEPLYVGGVGVRGVADAAPVGPRTLFHHGSCGKAFTGLLAAVLADAGVIDLDAPVRNYVPELRLPDPVIADRLTLRDLLSHRSGIGRHDFLWILDGSVRREEVVRRLADLPLVGDLRGQWSYSNLGYTLVGYAIERVTGSTWEGQLEERVLRPLGMTRTWASIAATTSDADHAHPHVVRDGEARPTEWRNDSAIAPAGGLTSCAEDSVRWLCAQLGEVDALPSTAVREAQRLVIPVPDGAAPFPELDFAGYGFGWLSGRYRDRPMVWHNGGIDGFTTQTLVLPRERAGVVVCANQHLTNFSLAAMLAVADAVLGVHSDTSWFDRLREVDDPEPPIGGRTDRDADAAAPSHPLAAYAGRYGHPGFGEVSVEQAASGLQVHIRGCELAAAHRHYDTWTLSYEPLDTQFPITFLADASGDIIDADVAFEAERPLRFTS